MVPSASPSPASIVMDTRCRIDKISCFWRLLSAIRPALCDMRCELQVVLHSLVPHFTVWTAAFRQLHHPTAKRSEQCALIPQHTHGVPHRTLLLQAPSGFSVSFISARLLLTTPGLARSSDIGSASGHHEARNELNKSVKIQHWHRSIVRLRASFSIAVIIKPAQTMLSNQPSAGHTRYHNLSTNALKYRPSHYPDSISSIYMSVPKSSRTTCLSHEGMFVVSSCLVTRRVARLNLAAHTKNRTMIEGATSM
ncbi:uncharacterized protein LAESUDRAFT_177996 [Laetiporus sulphureus 93-53]|uniref:Uncharacterized protein n=1 Tax=Laetiporus sulphureus 93-53 TaxID=1314785 RepID=A0A165E886_9APHY|nr:uncharacterized protein LAESUDRAFT_177996 [Laetiporus sulphureus 93-53]KZT06438.1 hypothetical protein LAESUDRAFT_177996 [Laetiporus sulphureus 93-53]